MKINFFKSTVLAAALVASVFGGLKAFQTYNNVGCSLMMENVEALSDPESNYPGYAKDYETGRGMYVTEILGSVGTEVELGMRISAKFAAQLNGSIKAEMQDEWKMDCQQNMGCYKSCTPEDWHAGSKSDGLVRGC